MKITKLNEKLVYLYEPDYNKLRAAKKQNITGFKVENIQSLADLLSMYRDEYAETSRFLFLNSDNIIVATINVTKNIANNTSAISFRSKEFNNFVNKIAKEREDENDSAKDIAYDIQANTWIYSLINKAKKLKATKFIVVHNHPSNNSIPSPEDFRFIFIIRKKLENICECMGGIILQASEYTFFNCYPIEGTKAETVYDTYKYSDSVNIPDTFQLNFTFNSNKRVDLFMRAYVDYITSDTSVVVFCDNARRLLAVATINNKDFNNSQVYNQLRNECKKIGAIFMMAFTKSKELFSLLCMNTYSFFFNIWLYNDDNILIDSKLDASAHPFEGQDMKYFNEELNSYMIKYWDGTIH